MFRNPSSRVSASGQQRPRNGQNEQAGSAASDQPNQTQFASTPRFSTPRDVNRRVVSYPPGPSSLSRLSFATPGVPQRLQDDVQDVETDIGDNHYEDENADMLDNEIDNTDSNLILPTPSKTTDEQQRSSVPILPPSPKRPRLTQPDQALSQDPPKSTIPRFIIPPSPSRPSPLRNQSPSTQLSKTTESGVADSPARPAFLKPSLPPPGADANIPLPEAFSPHRRGQRHVPGGMAAELSTWVVETGQAAIAARKGKGFLQGNDFVQKLKMVKVRQSSNELLFVIGKGLGGLEVRVMLAGGCEKAENVIEGRVVGIRAPSWETEVKGETWTVGVDWTIVK